MDPELSALFDRLVEVSTRAALANLNEQPVTVYDAKEIRDLRNQIGESQIRAFYGLPATATEEELELAKQEYLAQRLK